MKVINLPQTNVHAEQMTDIEKYIGDSREKFNLILSEIINGGNRGAHKAESLIFRRLSELGLILPKLF